ncbi:MAG: tetratricopeptide repeat protein [Planctomycetaceae bacterium]|jgi:hypothetical protein|nr:tetratricopeptide repeat protein [Planctomycetaceae bacterium]
MRFFVTIIVCLFFISVCVADSGVIRDGAAAFRNGEFEQAAKAFEKAAENAPRDLRLTYNHGVALAASGNFEGAIEVLRKSALDSDPKIAVLSLNSLAQIHINQAKQQLPENQNETPPEKRNTILELANKSEQYYMDILAIEPDNQNVKHNIEVLRLWKSEIESRWEQADRDKKRQSNLYERLDWIDNWQRDIANSISQSKKIPNSPKKYQDLYETAGTQQHLIGEIDAIRGDLEKQLQAENVQNNDQIAKVFDKIRETATEVKQSLDKFDENNAQSKAEQSNRQLSQLKFSIAPFEKIVEQAEKFQTQLVNNNPASNEIADNPTNNENNKNNEQNNRNVNSAEAELQHQVNDQQLIASLMPLMLYRAKEGLEAKRSQKPNPQPQNNSPQPNPIQPDTADTDPQQKSMELAIKYEPEIRQLAENAATLLSQNNHADALPKQKQAQKLLREILNQQNQNDQNQQNNQEQNSDQNQNNQQNQNEDNKESNDQNDQKNNEQKNSQQPKSADQKQEENKNEITDAEKLRQTEKAERLMRQVKRKQQEANERREELKNYFLQPAPVDKDW